jgi:uncharacterized membrane protein SpoIIM required for sporulation
MVLEKFFNPKLLRMHPIYALPTGFFFILLSFYSSLIIFPSEASIVMVTLASLIMLPYIMKIFEYDELDIDIDETNSEELVRWVRKCIRDGYSPQQIKDSLISNNIDKYDLILTLVDVDKEQAKTIKSANFLTRHRYTVAFYSFLFIGSAIAFVFLFGVHGENTVNVAFKNQLNLLSPGPRGDFRGQGVFESIISNNLRIMLICTLLSLLYGSGAIFILNYNASIAGVMFGSILRSILWGSKPLYQNLLLYLPHTSLEIFAYLLAAISGGILYRATTSQQEGSVKIWLKDSVLLFIISTILLIIAAWAEIQIISTGL